MTLDEAIYYCDYAFVFNLSEYEELGNLLKELKELRELEEHGLLIKMPCKVKQGVYLINHSLVTKRGRPMKCIIDEFIVDRDGCFAVLNGNEEFYRVGRFTAVSITQFGKTVFLTKEAAEQELKRLERVE